MDAGTVSIEELKRLHTLYVDLRAENYDLSEKLKKKDTELGMLYHKVGKLEDMISSANGKEKWNANELLLRKEIDVLKGKIDVQEEEFRLQQSTVMLELYNLTEQCRHYKEKLSSLQQPGAVCNVNQKMNHPCAVQENEVNWNCVNGSSEIDQINNPLSNHESVQAQLCELLEAKLDSVLEKDQVQFTDEQLQAMRRVIRDGLLLLLLPSNDHQHSSAGLSVVHVSTQSDSQSFETKIQHLQAELGECKEKMNKLNSKLNEQDEQLVQKDNLLNDMSRLLESKIDSFEMEKEKFDTEIKHLKSDLECLQEKHTETQQAAVDSANQCTAWETQYVELKRLLAISEDELKRLKNFHVARQQSWEQEIENAATELSNEKEKSDQLQQQLTSVHRKHSDEIAVLRKIADLKKQLRTETKRADLLQEKIVELLKDVGGSRADDMNELFSNLKGESGSSSSWSFLSGCNKESDKVSLACSDQESVHSSCIMSGSEMIELLERINTLKKGNYELQEKVQMLEEANLTIVEDLVAKNNTIEQLLKERHSGSSSVKGFLERMSAELFDNDLRTMNKKLQRVLENTLKENLRLQKDVENLTAELEHLSTANLSSLPAETA
ncbi:GRIP1-associated protein 1 [Trichinella pseudospiralis]|uniref:GRIP1-associated protein 1 n=2 Tax=Trichinella pseudospiralis TaxID=6337 RepID=A0A0V1IJR4_TRIPS|nr:GRIP1-associated protein 1 [Trichinella pseudospiralis]KRZ22924.1 GRIP1-associated protein 1 [Trichinella pseudospiralis]KRZ39723.1 GRIP1-associated protein 1 [Trichinella pseudospiralis]